MQVGTGKSILNGIAIGKLKLYKKKNTAISAAEVADAAAEVERFEDARAKAIDQQTALYEKALAEAGEDIAEVFNIHAMMLDDDDFVDAIKGDHQRRAMRRVCRQDGRRQRGRRVCRHGRPRSAGPQRRCHRYIGEFMLGPCRGWTTPACRRPPSPVIAAGRPGPSGRSGCDVTCCWASSPREGSPMRHTAILARTA